MYRIKHRLNIPQSLNAFCKGVLLLCTGIECHWKFVMESGFLTDIIIGQLSFDNVLKKRFFPFDTAFSKFIQAVEMIKPCNMGKFALQTA